MTFAIPVYTVVYTDKQNVVLLDKLQAVLWPQWTMSCIARSFIVLMSSII
jgi:hypothetical protein